MSEPVSRTRLQYEWALCALAVAASRFVPVPVADDLIKTRAVRTAIGHTWAARGRPENEDVVGILADDTSGLLTGLARSAVRLPVTLLLFPVRKAARMVTAVRGVSTDLVGVVLLARSVDRCLQAGWFNSSDQRVLEQQARLVRQAHEKVVGQADLRVLYGAVGTALREVGGLRRQALAFTRRVFGRRAATGEQSIPTGGTTTTAAEAQVEEGARQVVAVLDRPEIAGLLADLDRRFDDTLAELAGPAGPRPSAVGG